jgi:hypothetical protein
MRTFNFFPVAALAIVIFTSNDAQAASNYSAFCHRWHRVCQTTCPKNVPKATCNATCGDRLAACLNNGCYFFNNPGPKCIDSIGTR